MAIALQLGLGGKIPEFVATAPACFQRFVEKEHFTGPSVYYHHEALTAAAHGVQTFAEASYAMLVAWGMHRMDGSAKMLHFNRVLKKSGPF